MQRDPATYDPRNTIIDESKQADIENLGDRLRSLGEGQSLGDFSLTVVLYAQHKKSLDKSLPEIVGVFTSADGDLFAKTYNQLNAYFATTPGNYQHNLRKLYLLNSNYADLSFLFTLLPREDAERTPKRGIPGRARNRPCDSILPQSAQPRCRPHFDIGCHWRWQSIPSQVRSKARIKWTNAATLSA
jgi:hypothetical protein